MVTKATTTNLVTVNLNMSKETKNTFRFDDPDEDSPIPSVYIKKSALKDGPPESITVTVSKG